MTNRISSFTELVLLNKWSLDLFCPSDFLKRRIDSVGNSVFKSFQEAKVNPFSNAKNSSYLYYASKFYLLAPLKAAFIAAVTFTVSPLGALANAARTVHSYTQYLSHKVQPYRTMDMMTLDMPGSLKHILGIKNLDGSPSPYGHDWKTNNSKKEKKPKLEPEEDKRTKDIKNYWTQIRQIQPDLEPGISLWESGKPEISQLWKQLLECWMNPGLRSGVRRDLWPYNIPAKLKEVLWGRDVDAEWKQDIAKKWDETLKSLWENNEREVTAQWSEIETLWNDKADEFQAVNTSWNKTKSYATACFQDASCAAAGLITTRIILHWSIQLIDYARYIPLLGIRGLDPLALLGGIVIPIALIGLGFTGLTGLQSPSFASQFFVRSNDRVGLYLSMLFRQRLGLVSQDGSLLPFSETDQVEYQIKDGAYRFEGTNFETIRDGIFNAECELLETVVKCKNLQPDLKIKFQHPFNGEAIARLLANKHTSEPSTIQGNELIEPEQACCITH